jgi:DNA-binding NarL/FixJ family response regulator
MPKPYILIADDDPDARAILSAILSRLGIEVATATTGAETIALMEAHPPELLILDLMMPEMNGLEVMYWLRSHPELKHIPVIVVSAYLSSAMAPQLEGTEVVAKGEMRASQMSDTVSRMLFAGTAAGPVTNALPLPASLFAVPALPDLDKVRQAILALLTEREIDVLHLMVEGYSNKEIADSLVLSYNTVKTHAQHIFDKLNINERNKVIVYVNEIGLFDQPAAPAA